MLVEADSVSSIRKFSSFIKAQSKAKHFGIWDLGFGIIPLTKAPEMNPGSCRFWMTDFGLLISGFGDFGLSPRLNPEPSSPPNLKSQIANRQSHH